MAYSLTNYENHATSWKTTNKPRENINSANEAYKNQMLILWSIVSKNMKKHVNTWQTTNRTRQLLRCKHHHDFGTRMRVVIEAPETTIYWIDQSIRICNDCPPMGVPTCTCGLTTVGGHSERQPQGAHGECCDHQGSHHAVDTNGLARGATARKANRHIATRPRRARLSTAKAPATHTPGTATPPQGMYPYAASIYN